MSNVRIYPQNTVYVYRNQVSRHNVPRYTQENGMQYFSVHINLKMPYQYMNITCFVAEFHVYMH